MPPLPTYQLLTYNPQYLTQQQRNSFSAVSQTGIYSYYECVNSLNTSIEKVLL